MAMAILQGHANMPITPGPYAYEKIEEADFDVCRFIIRSTTSKAIANDGGELCDNIILDADLGICNEDDARLMTASWELLEALKDFEAFVAEKFMANDEPCEASSITDICPACRSNGCIREKLETARAAIAKATGAA